LPQPDRQSLSTLLAGLRAAGEETRLRILALLTEGELSVSDLTDIMGQSQPRISRHLKLMAEAGLIRRSREGAWAYYRLNDDPSAGRLGAAMAAMIDPRDQVIIADRERLAQVRNARAEAAKAYFSGIAREWDNLRSLHVPDDVVEAAVVAAVGDEPVGSLLDLGTGTGRMLQLLAPLAGRAIGVDASHAMLAVARANLEKHGLARVELRQGDIYALPFARGSFDLVLIHQVLHFLDDPARALRGAASVLAPGGRLIIVDFAPHELEFLRSDYAHRRLGFASGQVAGWLREAGLNCDRIDDLTAPAIGVPDKKLTVTLWRGRDPRAQGDFPLRQTTLEVA
jgi:ubiquinone/menaquinone biosynthesis C-methylase UbiE